MRPPMTTAVVAVITDVICDGTPVVGYAFNSTGRYACGAQMRDRFIPRILKAPPESLAKAATNNTVVAMPSARPTSRPMRRASR